MLRIVTHIERLLLSHDCVILPKFGGFVLQALPATFDAEKHLFQPMRKEVMFNGTLQHTDGLLSESYMQMYGVDYRKAQLMLEEDVDSLKTILQQDKRIELGKIGSFSLGEEGQVVFAPGNSEVFNADSYGLSSFYFPALKPLREESGHVASLTGEKKKDVFYVPVSRKLTRFVAASAAAVALFFVVSTPIKDVNQSAYTASFVPTEMINYRFEQPMKVVEAPVSVVEKKIESAVVEVKAAPVETKVEAEMALPAKTKKVNAAKTVPVASKAQAKHSKKMYYVVIASFPNEKQAKEYMSEVDRSACENLNKIVRNGKHRIYADRFDNRKEAEACMASIRKIDKFKDAWLFISR